MEQNACVQWNNRYTPAELKYFPINTALYSPHKSLRTVYAEPTDVPATGQDDSDDEGHEVTAHAVSNLTSLLFLRCIAF
jgi:hypothetical protein